MSDLMSDPSQRTQHNVNTQVRGAEPMTSSAPLFSSREHFTGEQSGDRRGLSVTTAELFLVTGVCLTGGQTVATLNPLVMFITVCWLHNGIIQFRSNNIPSV